MTAHIVALAGFGLLQQCSESLGNGADTLFHLCLLLGHRRPEGVTLCCGALLRGLGPEELLTQAVSFVQEGLCLVALVQKCLPTLRHFHFETFYGACQCPCAGHSLLKLRLQSVHLRLQGQLLVLKGASIPYRGRGRVGQLPDPLRLRGHRLLHAGCLFRLLRAALLGQDQTLKRGLVLGDCRGFCLSCLAEVIPGARESLLGFLKTRIFLCEPFLGCSAHNF